MNTEYEEAIRAAHAATAKAVALIQEQEPNVERSYALARLDIALDVLESELPEVKAATELSVLENLQTHWRGNVGMGPV